MRPSKRAARVLPAGLVVWTLAMALALGTGAVADAARRYHSPSFDWPRAILASAVGWGWRLREPPCRLCSPIPCASRMPLGISSGSRLRRGSGDVGGY